MSSKDAPPFLPERLLERDRDGNFTSRSTHIAVVALLTAMAGIDKEYHPDEFTEVVRVMAHEFHLMDEEAGDLRDIADFMIRDLKSLDIFVDTINKHYSPPQKERVLELVWQVARADGRIDAAETRLAEKIRARLKLS